LGASKVYAVEPTPLWELAAQLVSDNGLQSTVEVMQGRIEDLEPRPVDLAFSELLNADPFYEGVVGAMKAASAWTGETGRLVPERLRVYVALNRVGGGAQEARDALTELRRFEQRYDLRLGGLREALSCEESYRYLTSRVVLGSEPVKVYDLALGVDEEVEGQKQVEVVVNEPGPISGAVVWFEAVLEGDEVLGNAPNGAGHWGNMVFDWSEERGGRAGSVMRLSVSVDDGELDILPVDAS